MKILVIGQGGREHALAWKLAQSSRVEKVFVAPGNAGTHREPKTENVDISALEFEQLIAFIKREDIELTVVGPEAPLSAGIRDAFDKAGLLCFGPCQKAAQLESSKAFTKAFLQKYKIPTAQSATFQDYDQAKTYLSDHTMPVVIKADGLCGGKGVVIAHTLDEALAVTHSMLSEHRFGEASETVVIEEYLEGEEVSFIVMTDGKTLLPLSTSQDHKARDDEDLGPNTGGMGAYSPAPIVDDALYKTIMETIMRPTLKGLEQEGIPYQGFLYAGLMITTQGPKVLEFNCRLGDPETQPLLLRLESDLLDVCLKTLTHDLEEVSLSWKKGVSLGVVMAQSGYPGKVEKGGLIKGLKDLPQNSTTKVFHAGTKMDHGQILTDGGRVLCVTALGDDIEQAQKRAYQLAKKIKWEGAFYRKDIGHKALNHLNRDVS